MEETCNIIGLSKIFV